MERTFNWGIIGLGKIARKFASDLQLLPNARLHAVASASLDRAKTFSEEFKATHAYGSYEALMECPGLDVIYVATPHVLHYSNTLLCLANGIPVLCEKPIAMNHAEALKMVETARKHNTFLMEALWTRFIPAVEYALALVEQGEIGTVQTVKADFGFKMPVDPESRLFDKSLGGGSLLDIGIYPAMLAQCLFGKPAREDIQAAAAFTSTGVDETCAFTFRYPGNRLALGHSTTGGYTPVEAWIYGTEGAIYMHPRWHHTRQLTISEYDGRNENKRVVDFPYEGFGYHFEAAHVMQCLAEGRTESDRLPLQFSLDLMDTLDAVREKIGLEYT
jgi:predicted dehydrogenase